MVAAKILVVEDERITAEDIKSGLQNAGYIVPAIVDSGEDAIKKTDEFSPDLVLMDIKLKGEMDGIEAAGQIRRLYDIPVVYLTAYSDSGTVKRVKMAEPSGYVLKEQTLIKKPFEESELHAAIEITLHRHRMEKDHAKLCSTLLRSVNDGVVTVDPHCKVKFMNSVAEGLTGWLELDAVGMSLEDVLGFDEIPELVEEVSLSDAVGDDLMLKSRDGSRIPVNGTITPIKDEHQEIESFIVTFHRVVS
jgi:two-component system, response regulator PdtaR